MRNKLLLALFFVPSILLTFLVYAPALEGDFYHDDHPNILKNNKIQIESLNITTLWEAALSSNAGLLKRPVSMASFALNYYFFGPSPYSFKLTNLFLHVIVGILILVFLIQIQSRKQDEHNNLLIYVLPILATSVWLLNPLNVSTTAYIVQRMAILSSLFSMITIILYLHGRNIIIVEGKRGFIFIFFSVLSLFVAIVSKENAILVIPILLTIELLLFKFGAKHKLHKTIIKYTYLIGIFAAFGLFLFFLQWLNNYITEWYLFREFTLQERLFTQTRVLIQYIEWFFIPNINELGLYHDDFGISKSLLNPISTFLCLLVILITIAIAFMLRKREPLILLGVCWYFISHILESTILPLEMVYEHRNYFPSIGLLILIFAISNLLVKNYTNLGKFIYAGLSIYIFSLAFTTHLRASQWTHNLDFSYYEAIHHPQSPRAQFALGRIYANLTLRTENDFYDQAVEYLEKSAKLDSGGILPEASLILLSQQKNRPAKSEWYTSILKKLEQSPISVSDIIALEELVRCFKNECLLGSQDLEAIFNAALKSPNIDLPTERRAHLLSVQANYLLTHLQDVTKTEQVILESIELSPDTPRYYINYISFLIQLNRFEEARQYIEKLKKIDIFNLEYNKISSLEKMIEPANEGLDSNE